MADGRKIAFGIGIGCLAVIGVLTIAAAACGVWVVSEGRRVEREMSDPRVRNERVLAVLGTDRLPEGYYAMTAFSIPFVMDTALLTDEPPDSDGEASDFGERGFIYIEMLRMGQDQDELRDYFEGRTDDIDVLRDNGINVDIDELIDRGVLESAGGRLLYVSQRGDIRIGRNRGGGVAAITLLECESDSRMRMGIWFGPDPDPDALAADVDFSGTPADPAALRAFFGQFALCG